MICMRLLTGSLVFATVLSTNLDICTEEMFTNEAWSLELDDSLYLLCEDRICQTAEKRGWYIHPSFQVNSIQKPPFPYWVSGLLISCGKNSNVTLPLVFEQKEECNYCHMSLRIEHLVDKFLPPRAFQQFGKIRILNLNNLGIKYISPSAFEGLKNCVEIQLSGNNIIEIPLGVFSGLHLTILDLSNNTIKDSSPFVLDIPKNNFLFLNLSHNEFDVLEKEHSERIFQNLSSLDLSYNKISKLNFDFINESMLSLDVSHNRISEISGCIYKIPQVILAYNNIQNLQYNCSKERLKLTHLDIGNNKISELNFETFPKDIGIKMLWLQFNDIRNFSIGTFSNLMQLQNLNLSYNKICSLPRGSFESLENLAYLDLSNNKLKNFDFNTLHSFQSLNLLYIQNNILDDFDHKKLISRFPKLKVINFDNNIFSCSSLLEKVYYLEKNEVDIIYGTTRYSTNIRGVACYERQNMTIFNRMKKPITKFEFITKSKSYYYQISMFYVAMLLLILLVAILAFETYILYYKCQLRQMENVEMM